MILMEDDKTKAKRALMVPKMPCPTTRSAQELEEKAQPGAIDRSTIAKLKEMFIKKIREFRKKFPKHISDSKEGQVW